MIGSARTRRPVMKAQFLGWCKARPPRHHAGRQGNAEAQGTQGPRWAVQSSRERGPAQPAEFRSGSGGQQGNGPLVGTVRGWFASRPGPGVQRHPDGCVVHAFRCAPRSGADRRSAFPCQRVIFPGGVRAETGVIPERGDTPFAALRAAVPTGGRRSRAGASSFPAGVRAETGVIPELGDTRFRDPAGGVPALLHFRRPLTLPLRVTKFDG